MELVARKNKIMALLRLGDQVLELGVISIHVSGETLQSFKSDMEARSAALTGKEPTTPIAPLTTKHLSISDVVLTQPTSEALATFIEETKEVTDIPAKIPAVVKPAGYVSPGSVETANWLDGIPNSLEKVLRLPTHITPDMSNSITLSLPNVGEFSIGKADVADCTIIYIMVPKHHTQVLRFSHYCAVKGEVVNLITLAAQIGTSRIPYSESSEIYMRIMAFINYQVSDPDKHELAYWLDILVDPATDLLRDVELVSNVVRGKTRYTWWLKSGGVRTAVYRDSSKSTTGANHLRNELVRRVCYRYSIDSTKTEIVDIIRDRLLAMDLAVRNKSVKAAAASK